MLMRNAAINVVLMLLCASVIACGSGLQVTRIQLGRSTNSDGTIANIATTFAPTDTIYLSVATTGVGSATISVRWMYAGRVVDEPKKHVSYRDVAATAFELHNAGGFPPGDYSAEVFLDGQSVGTRTFKVEKP